jgi:hypothetical protein
VLLDVVDKDVVQHPQKRRASSVECLVKLQPNSSMHGRGTKGVELIDCVSSEHLDEDLHRATETKVR